MAVAAEKKIVGVYLASFDPDTSIYDPEWVFRGCTDCCPTHGEVNQFSFSATIDSCNNLPRRGQTSDRVSSPNPFTESRLAVNRTPSGVRNITLLKLIS